MYITERSLLLADAITKANFGYSYAEREAVINQTLAQKDSALAQKDSVITKSIVRLYTERQMSVTDIAALMDITPEFVAETLSSASIL